LADLRSADSKGKWWLVGAGWAGDPLADIQRTKETGFSINGTQRDDGSKASKKSKLQEKSGSGTNGESESDRLLRLARAQGMNTDIRRSVFVVLMSSDVRWNFIASVDFLSFTSGSRTMWTRVISFHSLLSLNSNNVR